MIVIDIKHDNILFLTRRQPSGVIIADFGLTTKYDIRRPYDSAQGYCGSLDYIPPEACRNITYGPSLLVNTTPIIMYYHYLSNGEIVTCGLWVSSLSPSLPITSHGTLAVTKIIPFVNILEV